MITVSNLTKTFKSESGDVAALDDVSFTVESGTFASIIGKSGSGKSTLLALLGALDLPTSGTIKVDDQAITAIPERRLTAYRSKAIGFVFQNYHLIPNLSALENVMLPMEFAKTSARNRRARAEELLNQVGLEGSKQSRQPGRLSGGEQQRVAIARALANEPKLILADEPTGNLDSATGKMIFDLLHELTRSKDITIIAVTHDLGIAGKTDVSFRLRDGKLVKVKE
jgi:putative ABC transport system ATP-binding protein